MVLNQYGFLMALLQKRKMESFSEERE